MRNEGKGTHVLVVRWHGEITRDWAKEDRAQLVSCSFQFTLCLPFPSLGFFHHVHSMFSCSVGLDCGHRCRPLLLPSLVWCPKETDLLAVLAAGLKVLADIRTMPRLWPTKLMKEHVRLQPFFGHDVAGLISYDWLCCRTKCHGGFHSICRLSRLRFL